MVADVADYEAFYRIWLPIELRRAVDTVEGARGRAHVRALEECRNMGTRQFDAGFGSPADLEPPKRRKK